MSQYYYIQKLRDVTENDLPALIELDRKALDAKPVKNEHVFHGQVYTLYIKYMQLINKLGDCCDQVVQPQKLPTIRKLYEMCVGRLLELKNQLVELDKSDFSYNDNVLNEMKLTIFDLVINPPYHLAHEREKEIKQREEWLEDLYKQAAEASLKSLEELQAEDKEGEKKEGEEKGGEEDKNLKEVETEIEHETLQEAKKESEYETIAVSHPISHKEITGKIPEVVEDQKPQEGIVLKESTCEELRVQQQKEYSDAALLIQRHERARQDYERYLDMKSKKYKKELNKLYKFQHDVMDKYAISLQALWRGYRDYKMVEHRRLGEYINLLGMYRICWKDMEPFKSYWQSKQDAQRKSRERLHLVQDENEQEYHRTVKDIHDKYLNYQSMWKSNALTKEIRQWFIDWYYATNYFPPIFPEPELGGSKLISEGHMPIPKKKDVEEEKEKMLKEKKKKREVKKKDTKGVEAKKSIKPETAKDKEKDKSKGFTLNQSEFIDELESVYNEYVLIWNKRYESKNDMQPFYTDMITKEQHDIADAEIRMEVDELMRSELKDLQMLDRSMKFKTKKSGKKKKAGRKVGKKKGKKGKKDLTGGRSETELFQELYEKKIIIQYPRIYLSSFVGEPSFNSYELRKKLKDPLPGLGEMRRLIAENIILPMVSKNIRERLPLVKSLCILGPEGFGKKTLVYSACTEVGALLFDITPENICEKYSGKKDIVMLMNILHKVSKAYQPSVIFINGGHKMFYKKVPRAERKYKAKHLEKPLMKFAKSIKAEDQILLLATSDKPWDAKPRPFRKLFEKFILLPRPEYRTMSYYLDETIMSYCNVPRDFTTTALATVCDGYSINVITKAIAEVMTQNRQLQLFTRPLDQQEFLDKIMQYGKISDTEIEKYIAWYKKWTALGVMREQYLTEQHEIVEQKENEAKRRRQ